MQQILKLSLLMALAKVSWTLPHQPTSATTAPGNDLRIRDDHRAVLDMVKTGPCHYVDAGEGTEDWYYRSQVTQNLECGSADGCATTKTEAKAFGWSVEAGANTPFSSAGFSVMEEWSSGQEYQCDGAPGDTVCVWVKVPYLQYNVKAQGYCDPSKDTATLRSVKEEGGNYYCVTGDACRSLGQGYWNQDLN